MNYVLFVMNNDTKQLEALACHPDKGEINGELLNSTAPIW